MSVRAQHPEWVISGFGFCQARSRFVEGLGLGVSFKVIYKGLNLKS